MRIPTILLFTVVALPTSAALASSWTTLAGTASEGDTYPKHPSHSCGSALGPAVVQTMTDGSILFAPTSACNAKECATGPFCRTHAWLFAASMCTRGSGSFECVDPTTSPWTSLYGFQQSSTLVEHQWRVSFATTDRTFANDPADVSVTGTFQTVQP